ncbi:tektin-1-like [Clinocottus analis]|uniref:tektin-1-like n=1 Tax=Clinocottus analis TaxID=304258 RepID=UPI0035C012AE
MSVPDCSAQQGAESNLQNMEFKRNHSELFRAECVRLIMETDTACKRMQNDDSKELGQRVQDIQFMTKELELKLDEIVVEIDLLLTSQSRVEKALEACKEPLRITLLCLEERMKRFPTERRHDKADRELLKEREVIEGAILILRRAAEQVTEQLRLNRSMKELLEQDLREKSEAQCIDNSCILMNAESPDSQLRPKRTQTLLPSLSVTPKQWENISDVNMAQAEQQLANSLYLRALLESLLEQTATDMQKQANAVATALQLNVWDLKAAKTQIEEQMSTIRSELASQQRSRVDLLTAIAEQERLLGLAQARLALRLQRPSKEQCLDPAQLQLLAEVQQINAHITKLREAVAQSEEEQRALLRCQRELQENLELKTNSLYIDEVICAQLREPLTHGF